jgi:ankyrin repeat protein
VLAYKGKVNYLLHQAAYNGCCELLEFLVRSNCPLAYHSRSAIGHTAFHLACISGSVPFLRRLFALSSRQDVVWSISSDIYGYTPMIYAVRFGHHLCVAELCAEYKRNEGHMFDIDKININGQTFLTIAASRGHALVCKVLLAYEADINLADRKSGTPPLLCAIDNRHEDVVSLLLSKKVEKEYLVPKSNTGRTPLLRAIDVSTRAVVKKLIEGNTNLLAVDEIGNALTHAAIRGDVEILRELLDTKKFEVDCIASREGATKPVLTPLMSATISLNHEAALLLLEYGANVNVKDENGSSIIHHACKCDNFEFFKKCADVATIDVADPSGDYPIHLLAEKGDCTWMEYLLTKPCDRHSLDDDGNSPLQIAIKNEHLGIVDVMLTQPVATRGPSNNFGDTFLHTAVTTGNYTILERLVRHLQPQGTFALKCYLGEHRNHRKLTPLCLAIQTHRPEMAILMIKHGASHYKPNIFFKDDFKDSPLFHAAQKGMADVITVILGQPKQMYITNHDGYKRSSWYFAEETLKVACMNGHSKVAKVIIEKMRELDQKVKVSTTLIRIVLWSTLIYRDSKHDTIRVLVEDGRAKLNDDRTSPEDCVVCMAIRFKSLKSAEYLLSNGAKVSTELVYKALNDNFPEPISTSDIAQVTHIKDILEMNNMGGNLAKKRKLSPKV